VEHDHDHTHDDHTHDDHTRVYNVNRR
jgi:hypothetical protein